MIQHGSVLAFYTAKDIYSNHHLCEFVLRNVKFNCAEQAIMYCKAKFFGDAQIAKEILNAAHPQEQKILGRRVKPFDERQWRTRIRSWYYQILKAKYEQIPPYQYQLLRTAPMLLAEASKKDRIWGVGLAIDDPRLADPEQWRGENLCGSVHMQLRDDWIQAGVLKRFEQRD